MKNKSKNYKISKASKMKNALLLSLSFIYYSIAHAQNVGIGTTAPNSSAQLEISSTSKGFLMPRMTTLQRNAIVSPAVGLQIFNLDDKCTDLYNGTIWIKTCGYKQSNSSNASTDTWIQKNDFGGSTRIAAVGFSIGNKGYIGTGITSINSKDFWAYDPVNNIWTQLQDFGGSGRYNAVGFSIGNKGYIGTGYDGTMNKKDFWEYDPQANTWLQKQDFGGIARSGAVGFSIGNKGYMGTGGDANGNILYDFWEYDAVLNAWLQKQHVGGIERYHAVGFSIGNKGYIGTGMNANGILTKDFWEYDPASNLWQQKSNFGGSARQYAVGFNIGTNGYIGTGSDLSGPARDFWEYYPLADTWIQKTSFGELPTTYATGFSIGNKGYIGTGSAIFTTKSFWEYYDAGITYTTSIPPNTASLNDGTWTNNFSNNSIYSSNNAFNVGIGTSTPVAKLQVDGGALLITGVQTSHIQGAYLEWNKDNGGGKTYLLNQKGLGNGGLIVGEIDNANNITERLTIDQNGNTGIGRTVPLSKLEVNGAMATTIVSPGAGNVTLDNSATVWNFTNSTQITLPAPNTCTNRRYLIINRNNGISFINGNGYLDFSNSMQNQVGANSSIEIISDGNNWLQIK